MRKKLVILTTISLILFLNLVFLLKGSKVVYSQKAYSGSQIDYLDHTSSRYKEYLGLYPSTYPNESIEIDATDYLEWENTFNDEEVALLTKEEVTGLYIPETVNVTWEVEVPSTGYYHIQIEYLAIEGRSSAISRGIMIDNEYPFTEAQNFVLSRIWEDAFNVDTLREIGKHDIKPEQIEKIRWNTETISDTAGYYGGSDYYFYFTAGTHEITFIQDKEPVLIHSITLLQKPQDKSYQEVLNDYEAQNIEKVVMTDFENDNFYLVQGENAFEKSSPILSPVANWSSYKVDPYEKFMMRYNTIGGVTWRVSGDWISWEVNAPKAGLYQITIKANQNFNQGMVSTRILKINNEVPFKEAREIEFKYQSDWQNVTLGDESGAYWFYLEEGVNTISLEATIGAYNDIILNTERTIQILSDLYRQVVMITGTNPDEYQDYMLHERIPLLDEMISESITGLESAMDDIFEIVGKRSSLITSFEKTLYLMNEFQKSESSIQVGLNELEDNISALGTWIMSISEQPLTIDCIYIHGEETNIEKASTNFFQKLWHEIVMLFGSYGANTSLESNVYVDGPEITVWIMSGQDQSKLLRQLIDEQFTVQENINVKLKLVSQTALLPATLSGNGPDVAIGVMQNLPVNWGIRNALVDLTKFPDYQDFASNFHPSAITPFEFRNQVYALPDTQDFLVSFVRDDIVEELNITVPATWEEVIDLLPGLQRQYLDYYLPNVKGTLSPLMYSMIVQNGGSLYEADGKRTLLLEENAMDAFIDFTTFFSDFGFEISANFVNRFRSGEMPLGISNYSLYNTLAVFAPEIRGKWSFAPLPGYEKDGVIYNQSTSTSTGTVILSSTEEEQASWSFVKWWLGEEAQTGYGRGMEAILGAAARYPTANLSAFENLPWSVRDYLLLSTQRLNTVGIPTVPGDYIIGRYIDNAFRQTVNYGTNPRDSLFEYVTKINIELERKRQEFNLD